MNADWHARHVMPKPATTAQRIAWHVEHAKECGCRPIPEPLQREIDRREADRLR